MKTQLVILSKTAGWIAFALGVIHVGATIVIAPGASVIGPGWFSTFLFMYVAAGLGCLLAGTVMLFSTAKAIRNMKTTNQLFLVSALFMLLLGIGAPIAMSSNPFGYISLASGVFAVAVALLRFREQL